MIFSVISYCFQIIILLIVICAGTHHFLSLSFHRKKIIFYDLWQHISDICLCPPVEKKCILLIVISARTHHSYTLCFAAWFFVCRWFFESHGLSDSVVKGDETLGFSLWSEYDVLGVADIRVSEEKQTPESAITKYSSVLGLVWMHMFILIHMCWSGM